MGVQRWRNHELAAAIQARLWDGRTPRVPKAQWIGDASGMMDVLRLAHRTLRAAGRGRGDLVLENLLLRRWGAQTRFAAAVPHATRSRSGSAGRTGCSCGWLTLPPWLAVPSPVSAPIP